MPVAQRVVLRRKRSACRGGVMEESRRRPARTGRRLRIVAATFIGSPADSASRKADGAIDASIGALHSAVTLRLPAIVGLPDSVIIASPPGRAMATSVIWPTFNEKRARGLGRARTGGANRSSINHV